MDDHEELTDAELAAQDAEPLPDREALSMLNADIAGVDNFAMPINEALAVNNESTQSVAVADADQTVIIGQSVEETEPDPEMHTMPYPPEGAEEDPS